MYRKKVWCVPEEEEVKEWKRERWEEWEGKLEWLEREKPSQFWWGEESMLLLSSMSVKEREGWLYLELGFADFSVSLEIAKKKLSFFVLKTSSRVVIEWRMVKWGYWRREEGEDDTDIEEGKRRKRKRESLSKGLHKKRGYYTEGKYRGLYNSKLM